jgi:hypothetical protein
MRRQTSVFSLICTALGGSDWWPLGQKTQMCAGSMHMLTR